MRDMYVDDTSNGKIKKEFIINEHITLKLIGKQTIIFLDGERFLQCKYLAMNLAKKDFKLFDEIESMDEAIDLYKQMNKGAEPRVQIDPEQEFIGHCSNLQAWVEHGYDPNILHTKLSYPLLRDLAIKGDKLAKRRVRECIIERISHKNQNTLIYYLEDDEVLHFFTLGELEQFYNELDPKYDSLLRKLNTLINRKRIIENYKRLGKQKINIEDRNWVRR